VTLLRVGERINLDAAGPACRIELAKEWAGTPATDCLIGVLCEDSLEVLRATELGADFIVLRAALAASAMADLQRRINLPIYTCEAVSASALGYASLMMPSSLLRRRLAYSLP
jgi:hypothetical protein